MKTIAAIVLAASTFVATVLPAYAACPAGTRYSCTQGYNGKVICSCQ